MNIQRGKIVSGGRLQLPAELRRQLGLSEGDTLQIEVVDGEIRLLPMRTAIKRIQDRMRKYVPEGVSVVDELIADRRREAASE